MIVQSKINTETRGRPRKEETRTLSPIYKQMFSDNCAILHSSFLIYVFEVFVETKNEKRVGHKDGGFTIYDKINNEYCFDNLSECLEEWRCSALLENENLKGFVKLLPALGPKIILREICKLINFIVQCEAEGHTEQYIFLELTHINYSDRLDEEYPYMRFVPKALRELKMDKNQRSDRLNALFELIRQRVDYLWQPLLKIIIHTVFNCIQGKIHNKYFKPFFSDAENPNETYIGQLNLDQVVIAVRRQESQLRGNDGNIEEQNYERLHKVRSLVDSQGTRQVVRIIKAPQASGGIDLRQSENIGLFLESPAKTPQPQPESNLFQGGGFSTIFKPRVLTNLSAQKNEDSPPKLKLSHSFDKSFTPKSQWKVAEESSQENGQQNRSENSPQSKSNEEAQREESNASKNEQIISEEAQKQAKDQQQDGKNDQSQN